MFSKAATSRIEIGLTGRAAHRGNRGIDDIDSCFAGLQKRGRIDTAGVVRVEVNRQSRSPLAGP